MNTYSQFITDIFLPLSGLYGDHFLGIDEVFEEMPSGLTYCIRPSFNFGDSSQYTNLREVENNVIITLQIFKAHNSNADIVFIAEDIRERILEYSIFKCNDYYFKVDTVNFQKVYDSAYKSIAVLIVATKLGKIEEEIPEDALTFTSAFDGSSIKISVISGNISDSGLLFRYNNDDTWKKYDFDYKITLNKDKTVQFKNTNNTLNTNSSNYCRFVMTGLFYSSGNCNSMINYEDVKDGCFYGLFNGCDSLLTSPKLPSEDIKNWAYGTMFMGCSRLLTPPSLPGKTIGTSSYQQMFENCTSMMFAPELPFTSVGNSSCYRMFFNCSKIETGPTILAPSAVNFDLAYDGMFNGCSKLKNAPELPATKLGYRCYNNMFNGCTSLTTPPELPATTISNSCYTSMFNGCTSLSSAPALPASATQLYCYNNMFNGCTSLITPPELPATVLTTQCYMGMFNGCTKLKSAPVLPASALTTQCYHNMFKGCTSLTGMADMRFTYVRGAINCCNSMYSGCTSLTGTFPLLPSEMNAVAGYYSMFNGCTALKEAPEIMATTISTSQGAQQMFYNCTSLNKITVHFTQWITSASTNWVQNVQTVSGTFICPAALSETHGNNTIPNNWTVVRLSP